MGWKSNLIIGIVATAITGGVVGGSVAYENSDKFRNWCNINLNIKDKNKLDEQKNQYEINIEEMKSDLLSKDKLIVNLKIQLEDKKTENVNLNKQIETLTATNKQLTDEKTVLETEKVDLQKQITSLEKTKSENEKIIVELEKEIVELEESQASNETTIVQLRQQIQTLQSVNETNTATITNLNAQVISLNTQINDLTSQIQSNSQQTMALNMQIRDLQESISYYEEYIASLENDEQAVVTFEFDGSVYNVQVVNKGSFASVVNPTSTSSVKFNYWTVNGERIDLSTYEITESVKIVADVTYSYNVNFVVDSETIETQTLNNGEFVVAPTPPVKEGYEFDGWTLNGTDVIDLSSYGISANTTFVAKFTKVHKVTFISENETISTMTIRNGNCVTDEVVIESTDEKTFNGWLVNGVSVDYLAYKIYEDTTFVADIIINNVVTFVSDDVVVSTQNISANNYSIAPTSPTKTGYRFLGWSVNGTDIVDVANYLITENTTFVAKFERLMYKLTDLSFDKYSGSFAFSKFENGSELANYLSDSSHSVKVYLTFKAYYNETAQINGSFTQTVKSNTLLSGNGYTSSCEGLSMTCTPSNSYATRCEYKFQFYSGGISYTFSESVKHVHGISQKSVSFTKLEITDITFYVD